MRVSYRDFCLGFIMEPLVPPGPILDMIKASKMDCVYRIPTNEEFAFMATQFHRAGFYSRSDLAHATYCTLQWGIIFPSPMEGDLGFGPVCGELGGPGLHGYPGYGPALWSPEDLGLGYGFMTFDTASPKRYAYAVVPAVVFSSPFFVSWAFAVFSGIIPVGSVLSFLYLFTGTVLGGSILDLGLRSLNLTHPPWMLAHVAGDRSLFSYNYLEDFRLIYEGSCQVH